MLKRRIKFIALVAASSLVLAGCGADSLLPLVVDQSQLTIDTPWEEFVIAPTNIKFNRDTQIELNRGETFEYAAPVIEPDVSNANVNNLTWTSSDPSVATVERGKVTAVNAGTAIINASYKDVKSNDLAVTVYNPIESFSLQYNGSDLQEHQAIQLDFNHEYRISPVFNPSDTSFKELVWEVEEGKEEYITINNGVIVTKDVEALVDITVHSEKLENSEFTFRLDIADRAIHVNEIIASLEQSEIEIGKTAQAQAQVLPQDATYPQVEWHSTNEEVARVDANGLISAVGVGSTKVYATGENNKTSNELDVSVFEVRVNGIYLSDQNVALANANDKLSHQLTYTYTVDKEGYEQASMAQFVFASEDPNVATVDQNGLITAVHSGNTTITLTDERSGVSASCNVEVVITVSSVTINVFKAEMELGSSTGFGASVLPANAQAVVEWSSSNPEVIEINAVSGVAKALAVGSATITATAGGLSDSKLVTVSKTPLSFVNGNVYLVGNRDYSEGSSKDGESWTDATYALKFQSPYIEWNGDHTTSWNVYKAENVEFHVNDLWKIRYDAEGWLNVDVPSADGSYILNWYEDTAGGNNVFAKGQMTKAEDLDGNVNIKVDAAGKYNIYVKKDFSDNPDYMAVYAEAIPTLSITKSTLTVGVNKTATNKISNWDTSYQDSVDVPGIIEYEIDANGNMSITGKVEGIATITITDASNHVVTCKVTVSANAPEESSYSLVGSFNDWTGGANPLIVDPENAKHFFIEHMNLAKGASLKVTDGVNWYSNASTWDNCGFTLDAYGNVVVSAAGTYKIDFYPESEYGNHIVLTRTGESGGGDDPQPASIYSLVGTFNNWTVGQLMLLADATDENHFYIENIELEADAALKVTDGSAAGWYSNESTWEGCQFTLDNDGNIVVIESGVYKIDFYLHSDYNNHIVITKTGEIQGGGQQGGDDPQPQFADYIIHHGAGVAWSDVQMVKGADNKYIGEVTLAEGDEFVLHLTGDVWRGYYDLDAASKALSNFTSKEESNNIVVAEGGAGTFVVTLNPALQTASIHIEVKGGGGQQGGDDPQPASIYSLVGTFNNWTANTEGYILLPDATDANHFYIENIQLAADAELKVTDGSDGWYGNESTWDGCGFTVGNGGNVVVSDAGTYKIDFYLEAQGNNHIVLTKDNSGQQGGGEDPQPATTYMIVGTFNNWDGSQTVMQKDAENPNHYYIENVELAQNDKLKGNDGTNWFTNDHIYDNCNFTIDEEGNLVVSAAGIYKIDLYVESDDGNHIVLTKTGDIQGGGEQGGDDPQPASIYSLVGSFNGWTVGQLMLTADATNANHFYIEDVELAAGAKLKVTNGSAAGWYGNESTWEDCGFTIDGDGNIVVAAAAVYKIDFYLEAQGNNHIVLTPTGQAQGGGQQGGEDPEQPTTSIYSLVGTFNNWTAGKLMLLADASDANHFYIENVELTAGAKLKITDGGSGWYGNASTWDNCGFTIDGDGNVVVSVSAIYTVNFYLSAEGGNHVTLEKTGNSQNATAQFRVNSLPDWLGNDNARIFAWCKGGDAGSGKWYLVSYNVNFGLFTAPSNITSFQLARTGQYGTPSWTATSDMTGYIYNRTAEIPVTSGVTTYNSPIWN